MIRKNIPEIGKDSKELGYKQRIAPQIVILFYILIRNHQPGIFLWINFVNMVNLNISMFKEIIKIGFEFIYISYYFVNIRYGKINN